MTVSIAEEEIKHALYIFTRINESRTAVIICENVGNWIEC